MLSRWWRYAQALHLYGQCSDVVLALSSVSVGIPLLFSRLQKPKKLLRLGGDFFWERYTDSGGMMTLREWHQSKRSFMWRIIMRCIFSQFDEIVYSTRFQEEIHETAYPSLPSHSVLENGINGEVEKSNALRSSPPRKLLFLGRFVGFKNLFTLLNALKNLPDYSLTLVGDGPLRSALVSTIDQLGLGDRVQILPPCSGDAKREIFRTHDLLVLPSITEISPNTALEATSAGLPVLLSIETGLTPPLTNGMMLMSLRTPSDIVRAIKKVDEYYDVLVKYCSVHHARSWRTVAEEWMIVFEPSPRPSPQRERENLLQ
jgi:glycosyltransferase involved in cell wall biosynthesis